MRIQPFAHNRATTCSIRSGPTGVSIRVVATLSWLDVHRGGCRRPGAGPGRATGQRGDIQPGVVSGRILRLHYARAPELEPWLDRVAVRSEVIVQFWLKPREQAVFFELGNEPPADPIPVELRRFL